MSHYESCYSVWFCWRLTGGVVNCRHLPQQQRGGVQGWSRSTGLLRHALHHLCLYLRRRADVPTATRDRWRVGWAPDCKGPDHHAVRQPVAPLHPLLLTGGLLPHPGLLRYRRWWRVKENMEGRNQGEVDEWMDLEIKAVSLIYQPLPLRNRLNDGWMDGCTDEVMKDTLKHLKQNGRYRCMEGQRLTGKS